MVPTLPPTTHPPPIHYTRTRTGVRWGMDWDTGTVAERSIQAGVSWQKRVFWAVDQGMCVPTWECVGTCRYYERLCGVILLVAVTVA